jgi:hypothetical protein
MFGEEGVTDATADGQPLGTPLVIHRGVARLNVAGCLALSLQDADPSACVGQWYEAEQCRAAACELCAEGGTESYESCRTLARMGTTCIGRRVSAECAIAAEDAGCGVGHDFVVSAVEVARAFCARPDAGDGG